MIHWPRTMTIVFCLFIYKLFVNVNFRQFLDNDDKMSSKRRNISTLAFLINLITKVNLIRMEFWDFIREKSRNFETSSGKNQGICFLEMLETLLKHLNSRCYLPSTLESNRDGLVEVDHCYCKPFKNDYYQKGVSGSESLVFLQVLYS